MLMECGNYADFTSRRDLLARFGYGLGAAALHTLLSSSGAVAAPGAFPNFAPRAKRVIFLPGWRALAPRSVGL
jgi:hypothetical protein